MACKLLLVNVLDAPQRFLSTSEYQGIRLTESAQGLVHRDRKDSAATGKREDRH